MTSVQYILKGPRGQRRIRSSGGSCCDRTLGVALQAGVRTLIYMFDEAAQLSLEFVAFGAVFGYCLVLMFGRLCIRDVVYFLPLRPPVLEPNLHLQR